MPYRQDWEDNHARLSADRDDAAPDWLRKRQRPRRSAMGRFFIVFAMLAVCGFGLYHFADEYGAEQWIASALHRITQPAPPAIALQPIDLNEPRIPQPSEFVTRDQQTQAPAPANRSLANCIRPGNVIDEHVINCRYGELPQAQPVALRRGMVSPEYLAHYKAEQAAGSRAAPRASARREMTAEWIRKWDGNGGYLAQWYSLDNRIDDTSVCANHRRGSIDFRECRKAAKVHFRKECRAWEKRWDDDRQAERLQSYGVMALVIAALPVAKPAGGIPRPTSDDA